MKVTVFYEYNNVLEENLLKVGFEKLELTEDEVTDRYETRKYIKEKEGYKLIFTIKEGLFNSLECITTEKAVEKTLSFMFTKNSQFNTIEVAFEEKPQINTQEWNKQGNLPLYEHKQMEKLYFYNKGNGVIVDSGAENVNKFKDRYNKLKLK